MSQQATPQEQQLRAALQQAAELVQKQKLALAAYHEPIAIVGMGCTYPGASDTPEQFWQNLLAGFDGIRDLPEQRIEDMYGVTLRELIAHAAAQQSATNQEPAYSLRGGFLSRVDEFDPAFFGLSPREVLVMDPTHRLLLETTWHALEDANVVPETIFNTDVGVFIGGGMSGYLQFCGSEEGNLYLATGNTSSTAAGRISYVLGITGPCVAIDTACSSSLTAVHLACQSLRNGECSAALAGGVNVIIEPNSTAMFAGGNMLSGEARCKTFDAAADGYVRGEGCGILVLKRLVDARSAGDCIIAVIRGTAVNQDGPSGGLTVPNGPAQERVIRRALADAKLKPAQLGYIEAHGTGTPLGDPIEIGALSAVFGGRQQPLYVGSVKTNIGHLEMAAGVAGLMKLALAVQHGQIPPHLHLHTPNPHIDWAASPVQVPTSTIAWPSAAGEPVRIGGISSFGFSGTNAHVIVAQAPQEGQKTEDRTVVQARSAHLLTISAKSEQSLHAYVARYLEFLAAHPDLDLGDLCYTSHVGRSHFAHRLSVAAPSVPILQQQLQAVATGATSSSVSQGIFTLRQPTPRIAFLFTGQGSQYVEMGRELYTTSPTFRAALDRCEMLYREYTGESLLAVLYPEQKTEDRKQKTEDRTQEPDLDEQSKIQNQKSKIDDTTYTQPALFALEYALATLWQSWGVQPDVLIGHSVGEVAAACVAGVFSLEDGMKLMAARGRLMGALPQDGAMIAVTASEAEVQRAIAPYADRVAIAAINGPTSIVISGQRDAVNAVVAVLTTQTGTDAGSTIQNLKSKIRNLTVSHAFHSPLMDPMLDEFRQVAESITYHPPKVLLVANVTGKLAGAEITTPDYWVRHVRDAVRFADGVATLQAQGLDLFLEIGPKPTLLGLAQAIFDSASAPQRAESQNRSTERVPLGREQAKSNIKNPWMLPSLRPNQSDWQVLVASLGELYVHGVAIDWHGVDRDEQRHKIVLPVYPFARQRFWPAATGSQPAAAETTDGFAAWLATHTIEQLTDLITERGQFTAADRPTVNKVLTLLDAEERSRQMAAQIDALLYEVTWAAQPKLLPVRPPATPGQWLLLSDGHGVGAALADALQAVGETVTVIASEMAVAEALAPLLTHAAEALPLRGILHLWGLNDGGAVDTVNSAELMAQQARNLGSVLELVQTLATTGGRGSQPRLWVITQGAQQLTPTEAVAVAQTPLWGLGRVIALEHRALWGGLIDLDQATSPQSVLAELLQVQPDGETQVAYRQGTRHVARFARAVRPALDQATPIRPDATYLITGGLGALGLLVADWLAAQGAGQLILTGRRGITSAAQQEAVQRLRERGSRVQIAQVDVADESAMGELFAQIAAAAFPLKGVFHTAGVLDDALLLNQRWARFAPVLAPKVTGAWLLHQLTQGLDLDFLVFFSSTTALLGNLGQGNYAAANAFLDGLARHRQQQGLPGLSINWGAWAEVGMAARTAAEARTTDAMIKPQVGIAVLARLLSQRGAGHSGQDAGQVAVVAVDWQQFAPGQQPFFANFVTESSAPALPSSSLRTALAARPKSEQIDLLRVHLQHVVGAVLGMVEPPDTTTGFTELGMDSLMALELRRRLEGDLSCTLPTTIAFEYPTVDELAAYLLQDVVTTMTPTALLAAPPTSGRTGGAVDEPIAVISMACRFPGADTPEQFWQLLAAGTDMVQAVPPSRWDVEAFYNPERPTPGKLYTREAAFVDEVAAFDPLFFGIAPREAIGMDPHHRLLLEMSWEALERAGLAPSSLVDSPTGVFVGIGESDYPLVLQGANGLETDTYAVTSSGHSIAAGRLAYTLGLQGPTLAVDTACSSSLVALHLACQSLRSGECDLALAGGVNLMLTPFTHIALSQMQALSPDGRCKTFDAAADGYGRGEGGAMVLLKRLSDATHAGDTILAVIQGSAVNHDGHSSGLTVPNKRAQEKLLRQALAAAQVSPDQVSYIEAHGTGTALGDPIEIRALGAVFGTDRPTPLLVGSVKTNVGHLEAAAGIAGFLKTVLALQHGQLPPHLHLHTPSPYIEWDEMALQVPTTLQPWPGSRIAGVSAFGLSGTNAHLIVTGPQEQKTEDRRPEEQKTEDGGRERSRHVLPLSAKNEAALPALAQRYLSTVQEQPDLAVSDLCYTAAVGRSHLSQRVAVVAADRDDLQRKLTALAQGQPAIGVQQGTVGSTRPRLAFLFTGQGAQYVNMGRELYETQPTFRAILDRCEALYQQYTGESLLAVLYPETGDWRLETRDSRPVGTRETRDNGTSLQSPVSRLIDDTTYTQPALFALEYALATLWQSWGVQPDLLIGHSVGEVAAACVAGVFSLEDGMKLIAARGRLMGALPQDGAMIAVTATVAEVAQAIAPYADRVAIAAINGPTSIVISGQRDAVNAVAAILTAEDSQDDTGSTIQNPQSKIKNLTVSHAFHSPLMDPMLDEFRQVAESITYHAPHLRLVSNVTGEVAGTEMMAADYWVRHVREAVRFADGIATLHTQGIDHFLEIGPKPTLLGMAQPILDSGGGPLGAIFDSEQPAIAGEIQIKNQKSKIH